MKRLFAAALLALTSVAFGATTTPVSLISPTGSTAGQMIISNGPSSPPSWGAAIGQTTFTGNVVLQAANAATQRALTWYVATAPRWSFLNDATAESGGNAGTNFVLSRYSDAGTFIDNPITVTRSTGVVTLKSRPVFGVATPWDSANLTIANYALLASPTFTGTVTTAALNATTLSASGNDALLYSNTSGQSIPNNTPTTLTTFTKVSDRVNANFNASTGTFTAPATGIYQVGGAVTFSTATGVSGAIYTAAVVANGVTIAQSRFDQTATTSVPVQVAIPLTVVSLTAGQTIVFQVSQSTGVARTMSTAAALNFISISRLP
jgi:hypothetical protein